MGQRSNVTVTETAFEVDRPAIIDETIDGEVVAVDLHRGSYYSIRGGGVEIWHALTAPTTPGAIASRIIARSGQAEPEVTAAVERFISELHTHGLLRAADQAVADDPRGGEPAGPEAPGGGFEPPQLEKFTDMEDLLLLDPVHDVDGRGWPHPAPS